jgi:hypothetical protein
MKRNRIAEGKWRRVTLATKTAESISGTFRFPVRIALERKQPIDFLPTSCSARLPE